MENKAPIGIFDSGYGGLTVLHSIVKELPQYDYIYLGDNARTPYGTRSFDVVYQFTLQGVKTLFDLGCQLVILACNTASAKALRTIQQRYLPNYAPDKRVLGVLRPTTEIIGKYSKTNNIGILGTNGTVQSNSYVIEISHFYPEVKVFQQACALWVPLIENNEHTSNGADYFVEKYIHQLLQQQSKIDTILLACTHYPLLLDKINSFIKNDISVVAQGEIVAKSLSHYLIRHPNIENQCSKNGVVKFFTTDSSDVFDQKAALFYHQTVQSSHIEISQ